MNDQEIKEYADKPLRTVITVATCSSRAKADSICATMPGAWVHNVDKYTFLVKAYSKQKVSVG